MVGVPEISLPPEFIEQVPPNIDLSLIVRKGHSTNGVQKNLFNVEDPRHIKRLKKARERAGLPALAHPVISH